jgi:YVTN family beta-propeller protein
MLPPYIYGIAADDTAVWVHNAEQGTVIRVDPTTNTVVATIHVGQGLGDVVLEAGFVWVGNHDDSTVSKIDPRTNKVVDTIALPPPTGFLGVSPGAVWVASHENGGTARKVDAQTDQVIATIFSAYGPAWSAYAAGSLWICNLDAEAAGVTRVDPTSSKVLADINLAPGSMYACDGIVAANDGVWAELLTGDGDQNFDVGLVRIDPTTNRVVTTIRLQQSPATSALAADAQGVWSAKQDLGLVRISPTMHRAVGFLSVPGGVAGVAVGAGSVWALNGDGTLLRITPAS